MKTGHGKNKPTKERFISIQPIFVHQNILERKQHNIRNRKTTPNLYVKLSTFFFQFRNFPD
jgi:hypothetical protein